ncbi:MAG: dihydroorotate dehydrogenase electron transfer subunit [Dehalococcoidia bacterium]
MKPVDAVVKSNAEVMPNIYLLWAKAPSVAKAAQPGQFVMVRASGTNDRILRRPLGVHRMNDKGEIALLYEVVGAGTEWLAQRKKGEHIDILGPMGRGFSVDSKRLLLVAGGVGIAPLIFLAERSVSDGRQVTLLFGAKTAKQVYPKKLIPAGVDFIPVTQDGLIEKKGMVTDVLSELIDDTDQVFACGPADMYKAMSQMKILKGRRIQVSMEARMGCGFGLCNGCSIKTRHGMKRVCDEGPVFELDELLF